METLTQNLAPLSPSAPSMPTLQEFLQMKLQSFRDRNPSFSGRAFAKRLGISPGALSEILNGTRIVSRKIAARVCDRLFLDPMERTLLLKQFPEKKIKTPPHEAQEKLDYMKLTSDQFKMMSEWYYFAILAFMKTSHFKSDVDHVADRLGLSRTQISQALDTLVRLQVLNILPDGTWVRNPGGHRTSDGLRDVSIRKNHLETLELAKHSLNDQQYEVTDFTSLTLPLDIEDLPRAKEKIRAFQNELFLEFNTHKKPKEVYRLAVQLFPLTKITKPKANL